MWLARETNALKLVFIFIEKIPAVYFLFLSFLFLIVSTRLFGSADKEILFRRSVWPNGDPVQSDMKSEILAI